MAEAKAVCTIPEDFMGTWAMVKKSTKNFNGFLKASGAPFVARKVVEMAFSNSSKYKIEQNGESGWKCTTIEPSMYKGHIASFDFLKETSGATFKKKKFTATCSIEDGNLIHIAVDEDSVTVKHIREIKSDGTMIHTMSVLDSEGNVVEGSTMERTYTKSES